MEDYLAILKEAHKQLTSSEKSIAIKDLAFCHRKKVFSMIDPVPMTEEELYGYVSGQAAHDIIERLFRMFPNRFRLEMEVYYETVRGKVDVYDKLYNCIIDIKTSSSQKVLLKPFKFHEEQVRYYMAIQDSEDGVIIYFMNSIYGKYRVFPIYMTAQERNAQLEKLRFHATSLLKAIEVGDPSLARAIYDDNEIKWLCNKCPYLEKCKELRSLDQKMMKLETTAPKTVDDPKMVYG